MSTESERNRLEELSDIPPDVVPVDEEGLKPYHVRELREAHRMAVILHTVAGFKKQQIAEFLGRSPHWVQLTLSHPHAEALKTELMTDLVGKLTEDVAQVINGASKEAVLKIVELMRHAESENVQLSAAIELKNTAGFKPTDKTLNLHGSLNQPMDRETAKLFMEAVRESKQQVPEYDPVEDSSSALGVRNENDVLSGFPVSRRSAPPSGRNGAD